MAALLCNNVVIVEVGETAIVIERLVGVFYTVFVVLISAILFLRLKQDELYIVKKAQDKLLEEKREIENSLSRLEEKYVKLEFEFTSLIKGYRLLDLEKAKLLNKSNEIGSKFVRSIEKNKALEKDLEGYNKKIIAKEEEINRLKKISANILDVTTYSIYNPMTKVHNTVDLLKNKIDEGYPIKELEDLSEHLYIQTHKLFDLMSNVVDIPIIDDEEMDINKDVFDFSVEIKKRIKYCDEIYLSDIEKSKITITKKIQKRIIVAADKYYILKVVDNLIIIAIANSDTAGEIEISLNRTNKELYKVLVSIRYCGIELSNDEIENIYKITSQDYSKGRFKKVGNGIGLVLSKKGYRST